MDRYVIVATIRGKGGQFNDDLRKEVFEKFNAKSSSLPAHFTIKGPFETDNIKEVEEIISSFAKKNTAYPIILRGYGHFDERVIYMAVDMSTEAKEIHDKFIEELDRASYIKFKDNEGKDKTFHVTITSKKIKDKFQPIWDYVNQYSCYYEDYFYNITIYKWVPYRWELYRQYILKY